MKSPTNMYGVLASVRVPQGTLQPAQEYYCNTSNTFSFSTSLHYYLVVDSADTAAEFENPEVGFDAPVSFVIICDVFGATAKNRQ